jgi:predicted anti-sigma-YlaC factor YlaD
LLLADDEADASVEDHLHGCAKCRALQEELRENALALSSLRDDAHQASQRRPIVETLPRQVAAPATVTAKLAPAPAAKLAVRSKPKRARRNAPVAEPLLVKMLTPDPDVVVYWIVD